MKLPFDGNNSSSSINSNFLLNTSQKVRKSAASMGLDPDGSQDSMCPSLTFKQRMTGFIICSALGNSHIKLIFFRIRVKFAFVWTFAFADHRQSLAIRYPLHIRHHPLHSRVMFLVRTSETN